MYNSYQDAQPYYHPSQKHLVINIIIDRAISSSEPAVLQDQLHPISFSLQNNG